MCHIIPGGILKRLDIKMCGNAIRKQREQVGRKLFRDLDMIGLARIHSSE